MTYLILDQFGVDVTFLSLCVACLVYTCCSVSVDFVDTSSTHLFWWNSLGEHFFYTFTPSFGRIQRLGLLDFDASFRLSLILFFFELGLCSFGMISSNLSWHEIKCRYLRFSIPSAFPPEFLQSFLRWRLLLAFDGGWWTKWIWRKFLSWISRYP